jgi:hypothetical protein
MNRPPAAGKWLAISLAAVALLAGAAGMAVGALLIPRTEVVEKPVEVVVEKRVEVPVEKQVIVERKVELPPPPFTYQPVEGNPRTATSEEIRLALLVRDGIRKANDAQKIEYEVGALFNPGKSVKVIVLLNAEAQTRLTLEPLRTAVVSAVEAKGFKVLPDDSTDSDWNTLLHVEVDLTDKKNAGRIAVTVRQGLMAFSNGSWKKVNAGIAHYAVVEELGSRPQAVVSDILSQLPASASSDLASAK